MQKYFTKWGHNLYPLNGEQHPNEVGYYLASDADVRIKELETALLDLLRAHNGYHQGVGPCICAAHENARKVIGRLGAAMAATGKR
jgi:hypothetical protein